MLKKIPENVQEDSGGMLVHIVGIAREISGGMFRKILWNTQENWTLYNAVKRKQNLRIYAQA